MVDFEIVSYEVKLSSIMDLDQFEKGTLRNMTSLKRFVKRIHSTKLFIQQPEK
jgi:hypothetical protein